MEKGENSNAKRKKTQTRDFKKQDCGEHASIVRKKKESRGRKGDFENRGNGDPTNRTN